ncbi:hypothetical protein ACJJIK_18765 [Microbulbifer sp. ZKSA006]|uniref:hypothetical protein n=1 Tax=Microbulbifer sp. ZKSA006 TaxID=3243390 RepID=UPI00403A1A38
MERYPASRVAQPGEQAYPQLFLPLVVASQNPKLAGEIGRREDSAKKPQGTPSRRQVL